MSATTSQTILVIIAPEDRPFLVPYLKPLLGMATIKVATTPKNSNNLLLDAISKAEATDIICTCPETLVTILETQPDFRHPLTAHGRKSTLKLEDYAGTFVRLPGRSPVNCLILNPLKQLVTVPYGKFITNHYISKILKPEGWPKAQPFNWEVWSPENSSKLLALFSKAKLIACDIETYRDDPDRKIKCVGYAGLFPDGTIYSIVVPYKCLLAFDFVRTLNDNSVPKIFQNGLYDNAYFLRFNSPVRNWLYDTLHLFHSWYAELPKSLDFLASFSIRYIRYWKDDAAGSEFNVWEYNARDCWSTLLVWCYLLERAPKWAIDNYILEFPLVFPCLHMELDGLKVDFEKLELQRTKSITEKLESNKRLEAWFGAGYNPNSPVQNLKVLKILGDTKAESSDAAALNACASLSPFNTFVISKIVENKKAAKLISTYLQPDKFWGGRLHYRTNPAGTETGRMASSESSFWCGLQIQNIPRGKAVKSFIVPDDGWLLAENDYAQSEARCVAYLSGCKALIDLVESDRDYHKHNASAFFGVPYEEVTKDLRDLAKRVNHGANYSMGAAVLLETMGPQKVLEAKILLKLPTTWTLKTVCEYLLQKYADTYPEVKKDWYHSIAYTIARSKKITSALGWTRYFFSDPTKSKPAMNAAVAHGPQNLSVAIINKVLYRLWKDSVYGDLRGKLRIKAQIHDSILYCYKGEDVPAIVSSRMVYPVEVTDPKGITRAMTIPNDTSAGGTTWGTLK